MCQMGQIYTNIIADHQTTTGPLGSAYWTKGIWRTQDAVPDKNHFYKGV